MKKLIPFFVAIVLIIIVVYVSFGKDIVNKYTYGQEKADLNAYFEIFSSEDVPIILQDTRIDQCARMIDNTIYFSKDLVEDYFTIRFYYDKNENLLLYTNAVTTISTEIGSKEYTEAGNTVSANYPLSIVKDDTLYIAADYLKKYVNFSYELFADPYHMQVYTEWGEKTVLDVKSESQVRWRAGIKSEILTDIKPGDVVEKLEVLDDWTKVKTSDGFIGYVETKHLENERTETEVPVTEVPVENYSSLTRDHKINLVWHNMEAPQGDTELFAACAKVKAVNVVSPTWYWLSDNEGNIKSIGNESYVDAAERMGMEVWPLVANFHSNTDADVEEVLSYTSKRAVLIDNLISETLKYGAHGINVDFETLPASVGDSYIQFIRELAVKCHENNLVLSVDNYVPTEYTAFYCREEQGKFADYVIIMGYDEHYAGSEVGSVASIPWMSDGIKNTIDIVPANKVINAIPFYTRVWKTSGGSVTSEAVVMQTEKEFIERNKNGLNMYWDEATRQNYAEGTFDGIFYQVWIEDAESVNVRLNVMNTYGIAGVAAWCLGQETEDVWDAIENYMNY